jgi:AcrR family transcriptional regulator
MSVTEEGPSTRERLLTSALSSFAARGYEATSLDEVATDAGVRKQTLLYYYGSKEVLLGAVIERTIGELAAAVRQSVARRRDRTGAVVDSLFRVGAQRPELLDLLREALRLGPPASTRLREEVEPLVDELTGVVSREEVFGAAAIVVGMATEVEVLRALGVEPTLAELRRRRRILLDYLTRTQELTTAET